MAVLIRSRYVDSLKLTQSDMALLVLGQTISSDGLLVALDRQPDNGCDCDVCGQTFAAQRVPTTDRVQ